jgi:hypothetical protein
MFYLIAVLFFVASMNTIYSMDKNQTSTSEHLQKYKDNPSGLLAYMIVECSNSLLGEQAVNADKIHALFSLQDRQYTSKVFIEPFVDSKFVELVQSLNGFILNTFVPWVQGKSKPHIESYSYKEWSSEHPGRFSLLPQDYVLICAMVHDDHDTLNKCLASGLCSVNLIRAESSWTSLAFSLYLDPDFSRALSTETLKRRQLFWDLREWQSILSNALEADFLIGFIRSNHEKDLDEMKALLVQKIATPPQISPASAKSERLCCTLL